MKIEVKNCIFKEMKISRENFEKKYNSFNNDQKKLIDEKLLEMFKISYSIKNEGKSSDKFYSCFYEDGDEILNEFLQSMFDVFKEWQLYTGIQLQKQLYEHTNRNTDKWFPLVIIEEQISECSMVGDNLIVYRGCNHEELDNMAFQQRQAWTTDFDVAKSFAFRHASKNLDQRIVIKATINRTDVLWDRKRESELVLRLGFIPESYRVAMTYNDHMK